MSVFFRLLICLLLAAAPSIAGDVPNCLYTLPYQEGEEYQVSLAYNDFPTHEGNYAIDWLMDEGTPILATRDGTVFKVVDSFNGSGLTPEFKNRSNHIVLKHSDDSFTEYHHLAHKGVKVKVGQAVKTSQIIALSGNVGFSSTPHLHFMAYQMKKGKVESFPVRFVSGMAKPYEIFRSCRYLAPGPNCKPTVDPFERTFPGELAKLKFKLSDLVRHEKTSVAGAKALHKHLKENGASYKEKYQFIHSRAQAGDAQGLEQLEGFANSMDLRTDPEIERLFKDPRAAPIAEEAIELWNMIQVIE